MLAITGPIMDRCWIFTERGMRSGHLFLSISRFVWNDLSDLHPGFNRAGYLRPTIVIHSGLTAQWPIMLAFIKPLSYQPYRRHRTLQLHHNTTFLPISKSWLCISYKSWYFKLGTSGLKGKWSSAGSLSWYNFYSQFWWIPDFRVIGIAIISITVNYGARTCLCYWASCVVSTKMTFASINLPIKLPKLPGCSSQDGLLQVFWWVMMVAVWRTWSWSS